MPKFCFKNFDAAYVGQAEYVATFAADTLLLSGHGWPPLKSNKITVHRFDNGDPMYAANLPHELIFVGCGQNRPYQFAYQLSHELGHLTTRADLRYPRLDGNQWIEEVLCGAYSLIVVRAMSMTASFEYRIGAQSYLTDYIDGQYDPTAVSTAWFGERLPQFHSANTLTEDLQKVAGYLEAQLSAAEIIAANKALRAIRAGALLAEFLDLWELRCGVHGGVPSLLRTLGAP